MTRHSGTGRAITDPLTGAYSRALLIPRLGEELSRAGRSGTGGAVFLFDVDYFKSVNDAYGHQRGDEVLRELVARINGLVRGYDVVFRYGGDEFVVLLPETDKADAVRVALRLVEGVRGTPFPGDPPLRVSVSLGVALFPQDATDADGLLACADRRNYLAKQRGRACAVADDADVGAQPESSRLLERDVPLAVAHEFLTGLCAHGGGALRVAGEAGAGHSRFLDAVDRIARLRGFAVTRLPAVRADDDAAATGSPVGTVVLADRGYAAAGAELVRDGARAGTPVGLVYASAGAAEEPPPGELVAQESVELLPWSAAALRIWLRTRLRGEPDQALIEWLTARTGGLPARVEREADRLSAAGGLAQLPSGGFTLAPALLARRAKPRRRLPVPLTELVGRQPECVQVAHLLDERRLVTLVGAGGIGKTRLSLAVAAAVADRFADGVLFVPLDEVAAVPAMVLPALARALDIREVPGRPLAATVAEELADASLLLVLDNFEHVMAAAPVVGELLSAAPGLRVLASSRERLNLSFEQVYPVPPLPLPDPAQLAPGTDAPARALAGSPALALFAARARAAAYDFTLTDGNLRAVAELCRRLDGLPLAIELAAARSDSLTPAQMLAELSGHLEVCGDGPGDLPARQRTLRGAVDWSLSLLDPVDRDLFERLGAFAGGCDARAAAAVCRDLSSVDGDLGKRLSGLADKSLLRAERRGGQPVRYAMLQTIHAYAAERLAARPDADAVYRAHASHYAGLAVRAGRGMTGPRQAGWAARVEREYQNLGAAFDRSLASAPPRTAVRVALGLWRFWRTGSHLSEGRQWLGRLVPAVSRLSARTRAQVLHAAAVLAAAQDDHESAATLATESLALARQAGDARTSAQAGNALGIAALAAGDYPAAHRYFTDSLAVWSTVDELLGLAIAHGNLTKLALRTGDVDAAAAHAGQCLALDRRTGNTRGIMLGLLCLGEIMLTRQDTGTARAHLTEALAHSRSLGDVFGEAMARHLLGQAAWHDGDRPAAVHEVATALALRHGVGDREDLAVSLEVLAALLADGDPALARFAARLLGAAQTVRSRHRLPEPGMGPGGPGPADPEAILATLRARLGAPAVAAAFAVGQGADLDSIVTESLTTASAPPTP